MDKVIKNFNLPIIILIFISLVSGLFGILTLHASVFILKRSKNVDLENEKLVEQKVMSGQYTKSSANKPKTYLYTDTVSRKDIRHANPLLYFSILFMFGIASVFYMLLSVSTCLLFLQKIRNSNSTFLKTRLVIFLPEEYIAELEVLRCRMERNKAARWEIQLRICQEIIILFWVSYVQIKLENLFLPRRDRKIDD